jgi:23S rRNA pseudouridine1911/1915/1917 synthase
MLLPQQITLTEKWLALSKPAGWLTIPGRDPGAQGILSEWAQQNYGRIWVVHRLDRDTSGIVLFARSAQDHAQANEWFEKRKMKKIYDCIAAGKPATPIFKLNAPIRGDSALTQVEVRERFIAAFLARVRPLTGRRHQIRIHLSQKGYPLLGDVKYGGPREVSVDAVGLVTQIISRVALHAASLELPSGEKFEAPWPLDFKGWVDALRRGEGSV